MAPRSLTQTDLLPAAWQVDIARQCGHADLPCVVGGHDLGPTDRFALGERAVDVKKLYRIIVKSAFVLFAALVVIWIVNQTEFFQIDSCMDRGGRWLHETAECDTIG